MTIRLHRGDLPDLSAYKGSVAIDTEAMGLDPHRDRLCVVQLSPGDGLTSLTQIDPAGSWFAVPLEVQREAWPTEDYHLARSLVNTELPESDLFAGVGRAGQA